MPVDSTSVNLRLPRGLHARLKDQAARDRRSLNAEIVWLLERALPTRSSPDDPKERQHPDVSGPTACVTTTAGPNRPPGP